MKHESRITVLDTYLFLDRATPSHKNGQTRTLANCECVCGNKFTCRLENINSGVTTSCGCLKVELLKRQQPKATLAAANKSRGTKRTPAYVKLTPNRKPIMQIQATKSKFKIPSASVLYKAYCAAVAHMLALQEYVKLQHQRDASRGNHYKLVPLSIPKLDGSVKENFQDNVKDVDFINGLKGSK